MVKVTHKQWEEVVIHESINYTLEKFINIHTLGIQAGGVTNPLNWAKGVVFKHVPMPPIDIIIQEQLNGKVHLSSVEWALMPKYKNFILIEETNIRIPITDVSINETLCEIAISLKMNVKR